MKVLVDTNVLLDILEEREEFLPESSAVIQLALEGKIDCIFSAGAVTDVYYIVNRFLRNPVRAREAITILSSLVRICDTSAKDIAAALILNISDFEDAVSAAAALREKAEYIVTRNLRDFQNSPVPALSPAEFLQKYGGLPPRSP